MIERPVKNISDPIQTIATILFASQPPRRAAKTAIQPPYIKTSNHLPNQTTLNDFGQSTFSETAMEGMGFGLGFSVLQDPIANAALGSQGQFAWGGAASTRFWVDPKEELTCVFMTQFMPSSFYPIRRELKAVIYQALR